MSRNLPYGNRFLMQLLLHAVVSIMGRRNGYKAFVPSNAPAIFVSHCNSFLKKDFKPGGGEGGDRHDPGSWKNLTLAGFSMIFSDFDSDFSRSNHFGLEFTRI